MINGLLTRATNTAALPRRLSRSAAIVTVVASSLVAGCASNGAEKMAGLSTPSKTFTPLQKKAAPVDRAIQYWSQKFAQNPGDEKAAVAYARNLRAKGEKQKALGVLQRASMANSKSRDIASEYARVAIDLGQIEFAQRLIQRATDPSRPDWRLISAQGAGYAKQGKHKEAQKYFIRALDLKPAHPPLLNNLALSYALNGEIDSAEQLLRRAAAKGQNISKIKQNLALVLGVQGKFDESQQVAQAVYLDEGRAQSNTEFLKRWVKADPQSAPTLIAANNTNSRPASSLTPSAATSSWSTEVAANPLRGSNQPTQLVPWSTETQVADATWAAEVADGQ